MINFQVMIKVEATPNDRLPVRHLRVQLMNLQQPIEPSKPTSNTPDQTSESVPPELPIPEQCAAVLMETMHPIMQFIRAEMRSQREPSLSVPQFRLLAFLSRHPGASLSEVSEHLGVTRATASAMTERLVQRNWVERTADPQERRQIMLTLTESGQTHLEQMRDRTRHRIAELLNQLSTEELADVSAGLAILSQVFQSA
jgi:DNA-binding MarR family transcriptional regulator